MNTCCCANDRQPYPAVENVYETGFEVYAALSKPRSGAYLVVVEVGTRKLTLG